MGLGFKFLGWRSQSPGQNYWFLVEMEARCDIFILKSLSIETESNTVLKNCMSDINRVYFSKVRISEFY